MLRVVLCLFSAGFVVVIGSVVVEKQLTVAQGVAGLIEALLFPTLNRMAKTLYPHKDGDPWYVQVINAVRRPWIGAGQRAWSPTEDE